MKNDLIYELSARVFHLSFEPFVISQEDVGNSLKEVGCIEMRKTDQVFS